MATSHLRQLIRKGRNWEPTWRYLFNFGPMLAYRFQNHSLPHEAARVLGELNHRGVSITSCSALLGSNWCYNELATAVQELQTEHTDSLQAARLAANDSSLTGNKSFIFHLLGETPLLNPESIYTRFALQSPILQIANAYFGMLTRLRYYNVWHTFTTQSEARESQLWHYDREDYYILKLFVYLSDVDENSGPFTYAPGTHHKAKRRGEPESFMEGAVRRSTDQQMARFIPEERWVTCTGPKATIVFADTRGYHKGGLAHNHDRLMYTCMFTSQTSQSREFLKRSMTFPEPINRELAFALSTPGIKVS